MQATPAAAAAAAATYRGERDDAPNEPQRQLGVPADDVGGADVHEFNLENNKNTLRWRRCFNNYVINEFCLTT